MRISDWSSDVCSSDLTRDHEDDDPHRTAPDGKAYMPWHDSTMILAGRVGNALADLGNERWQRATKRPLRDLQGKGENWPGDLEPDFEGVDVAISRPRAEYDGCEEIGETEHPYLTMIADERKSVA